MEGAEDMLPKLIKGKRGFSAYTLVHLESVTLMILGFYCVKALGLSDRHLFNSLKKDNIISIYAVAMLGLLKPRSFLPLKRNYTEDCMLFTVPFLHFLLSVLDSRIIEN